MLVINGVDAQTNSHSAGIVHNWSGRVSEGYPSMTALLAAHHGPRLPLSYLNFGGFSATTASLVSFTRVHRGDRSIRNIANPGATADQELFRTSLAGAYLPGESNWRNFEEVPRCLILYG